MAVLVLGMHRSGTSLITEILGRLGLHLGRPEDLIGSSPFNERGHFELLPAVEFDNLILQRAGGTWDAPPPGGSVEALTGTLRPSVDDWFGPATAWAFKDPRLCLTLPVWLAALTGIDVRIVHVLREPYAVACSLVRRNAQDEQPASRYAKGELTFLGALGLWAEYNRRATIYAEASARPYLVVSYDQLLASPRSEVGRIATFVGADDTRLSEALACVQPQLRHHP
jgi:hypothetical protein